MTEHPLTDEKVYGRIQPICEWAYSASMSDYDRILHGTEFDMEADRVFITEEIEITTKIVRDAYDLGRDAQLEQVIEWLRKNLGERYIDDGDILAPWIYVESVVIDLKQAMRPTQENNNE